ncbi:MAG: hypothetical protein ACE5HG_00980 [Candidatus Bathyarchaeia archaeon]
MSNESGVVTCPNPKCHKKIEEPIRLNNLSATPAEQYYACPHCFIKLDADVENDENITQESAPSPPLHPSLEKVLDVISAQPQKEEEKKEKEEPPVKPAEKKGEGPSGCPHHFGYLTSRARDAPIPQECLICPKVVECMLKLSDSR